MMARRRQLERRCEELGCELSDDGLELEIFTPIGKRIVTTQTHMLVIPYDVPRGRWRKGEAYAVLLEDLGDGLEPCDEPGCDYCAGPRPVVKGE